MAEDTIPAATFTVTYDPNTRIYSISPASQQAPRGGRVTLIAVGASSISLIAKLSSDNQPYSPLGTPPYTATPSPGMRYELSSGETSTGYLDVDGETTDPTGTMIPVGEMAFGSGGFSPAVMTLEQGGLLQLTWSGREGSTEVKTFDSHDEPYPLFGGAGGNSYMISSLGTTLTVPLTVPVADGYYIELPDSKFQGEVPVRGTINVTIKK